MISLMACIYMYSVHLNALLHLGVVRSFAFQGGSGCCVILYVSLQVFAESSDSRMHQHTENRRKELKAR